MYQTLLTELADGICTITINRPEKLNALNKDVIAELGMVLEDVYANDAIRAVIITGAGEKSFVAGADISEFTTLDAGAGSALAKKGQQLVFDKIENSPKPVVAAVNGFALGGGCELALACHFRIAAAGARFGQPEVNLGLIPGYGGTQRLTQLIGKGRAIELLMSGAMIDAQEAMRIGLVNQVTEAGTLLQVCREKLHLIMAKAPLAVAAVIKLANMAAVGAPDGLDQEVAAFGSLFGTADMQEGVTAFLEKRKPVFTGK